MGIIWRIDLGENEIAKWLSTTYEKGEKPSITNRVAKG